MKKSRAIVLCIFWALLLIVLVLIGLCAIVILLQIAILLV